MRKMMKILVMLSLAMFFAMGAMAQNDNANTTGKALIVQGIDVVWAADLNFGWVSPGLNKTVALDGTVTGSNVGKISETTGLFHVMAAAGSDVQLQFTTLPGNLVYSGNDLTITYVAGWDTADDYSSGTDFTTAATSTQVASGTFPTNTIGTTNGIYVFIGGTVAPTGTQVAGEYTGTITLTATYN